MGPKVCSPETLTTWEGLPGWAVIVPLRRSGVSAARIVERLTPYCFDSSSSPGKVSLKSPERIRDSRSSRTAAHSGCRLRGDRSSAEEERPDEVTMSPVCPTSVGRFRIVSDVGAACGPLLCRRRGSRPAPCRASDGRKYLLCLNSYPPA